MKGVGIHLRIIPLLAAVGILACTSRQPPAPSPDPANEFSAKVESYRHASAASGIDEATRELMDRLIGACGAPKSLSPYTGEFSDPVWFDAPGVSAESSRLYPGAGDCIKTQIVAAFDGAAGVSYCEE